MKIDLESLGLTKDELQERIVSRLCEQLMTVTTGIDEDDQECYGDSPLAKKLTKVVKDHVDAKIAELAEKMILPNVSKYVENLCLEETNKWGEKKGTKISFIEYLVQRAENYMQEQVNFQGKSKAEEGYSWSPAQSRITYLVNSHLQYSISTAIQGALKDMNSKLKDGLEKTIKTQLDQFSTNVKVALEVKSK